MSTAEPSERDDASGGRIGLLLLLGIVAFVLLFAGAATYLVVRNTHRHEAIERLAACARAQGQTAVDDDIIEAIIQPYVDKGMTWQKSYDMAAGQVGCQKLANL